MKSFKTKVLVLVLLVSIGFLAGLYVREQRLKAGFLRIQEGDTREQVIKQLGQPGEVSPCFHPSDQSELQRNCAEEFWYYSFLERWGISFDAEGRVIVTTYNVSY